MEFPTGTAAKVFSLSKDFRDGGSDAPAEVWAEETVSVFESLRGYQGILFRLEDHLERLRASAKTVGMDVIPEDAELGELLYEVLKRSGSHDAFLRLTVTSRGLYVIVTVREYPPEVFRNGVRLQTSTVRKSASRSFYPEAKTSNYGAQVLATLESPEDAFEILFLGEDGTIRECRTSNIFIVRGNRLVTPPAAGILEGVTRRTVLECAQELELSFSETYFTRHDVFNAAEAFLTNTSGEIIPVRELDGRRIGKEVPGIWTRRLSERFRKKVSRYRQGHRRAEN